MSTHITVGPVTRIEGHLRIDVEVDGGVVKKAWSSGQMFRGIERILEGRDPRDAWVFRAVENALTLEIPKNPKGTKSNPVFPRRDRRLSSCAS